MAFRNGVKKLLSKSSRSEEMAHATESTGAKPVVGDVDIDLVSAGILLSENFGLFFGKSTFECIVAETIQKEDLGLISFSLIDILEQVAVTFNPDTREVDTRHVDSRPRHFHLYNHIYDTYRQLDDAEWKVFRQSLSSRITTSCIRLRNENIPELDAISTSLSSGQSNTHTSITYDSDGGSSSSSSWSPPSCSRHQPIVGNSATTSVALKGRQGLQPLEIPSTALDTAVDMHKYTSMLKELADSHGGKVRYEKKCLSFDPVSWHYTATFGGFTAEGIGRNLQQAKHAASKELCELLGLSIQ